MREERRGANKRNEGKMGKRVKSEVEGGHTCSKGKNMKNVDRMKLEGMFDGARRKVEQRR